MNLFCGERNLLSLVILFTCITNSHAQQNIEDIGAKLAVAELASTEKLSSQMYRATVIEGVIEYSPSEDTKQASSVLTVENVLSQYFKGEKSILIGRWYQDGDKYLMETRELTADGKNKNYNIGRHDDGGSMSYIIGGDDVGMATLKDGRTRGSNINDSWGGNFGQPNGLGSFLQTIEPRKIANEEVNQLKSIKIKAVNSQDANRSITYLVWLAPERSFREVRKHIIATMSGPTYVARHVWYEPLSFVKLRGVWVPSKGVYMDWLVDRNGSIHWRDLRWFELTDIRPLDTDTKSVFDFDIPVGARVLDSSNKESPYSISGGDPRKYIEIFKPGGKLILQRFPTEIQEVVARAITSAKSDMPEIVGMPDKANTTQLPRAEDNPQNKIALPQATMKVGQAAPDFSVTDANGKTWKLSELKGKKSLVLTFFPKCFTGGCANHLSSLRDHQAEFDANDVQILAVSVDPADGEKGQKAFASQWKLMFPLIPDTSRTLSKLYGAAQSGDERAARMTFVIDKSGIVRWIDTDVQVKTHGADVLAKLRELKIIE